jgi:hypothetical protein
MASLHSITLELIMGGGHKAFDMDKESIMTKGLAMRASGNQEDKMAEGR